MLGDELGALLKVSQRLEVELDLLQPRRRVLGVQAAVGEEGIFFRHERSEHRRQGQTMVRGPPQHGEDEIEPSDP